MSRVFYPEARVVVYACFEGTALAGAGAFGSSLPEPVVAFPVLPVSADICRNGYQQADSWSIDFDYDDFPIAPQSLKSCAVEIYLYDRGSLNADLASLVGTAANPGLEPVISGLCDDVQVECTEQGSIVTLEGQDYTGLFLEHSWRTTDAKGHPAPIPSGRPLDDILRDLIREVDVTGRITLEVRVADGVRLPVVGAATSRTVKSGFKADSDASYWTVMSKIARVHGFLLFVEGSRVVLSTPDSVHNRLEQVYRLRWGRNIKMLRMSRALGKERVPQIEVRCYDDETRTTLVERFPERGQQATTGIGTKRDERRIHTLYGIRDREILRRFARNLYELIARGEQEAEVETDDLVDQEGLDFLQLRAGSALMIEFDAAWNEVRNLQPAQIYSILIGKGFPPMTAQFLTENYRRIEALQSPLYVHEARLRWDVDDGVSVEANLINFVDPRNGDPAP